MPSSVQPFPLAEVQLADSPFRRAMTRNADYLLSLDANRLLHNTRKYAGLAPKGELYGGWEAKGIAGHTLGHYLTALSHQYAATKEPRFRDRISYVVSEMAKCQAAYGDGYIGALPPKELETMRNFQKGIVEPASAFNFKGGAWVPWYTQHKVLAGLIDAWTMGDCPQARDVALKLADWVDAITRDLSEDQRQRMLEVEHGGMLESMVQMYRLTGDKKYLSASKVFYHKSFFEPLRNRHDKLDGRHANTQIPKVLGEAVTYETTGAPESREIAEFFWNTVAHNRSWVIGGNSDHEHFFPQGKAHEHLGPVTAESCNTYNMLKLTRHLFEWRPSVDLADYYERALYNHILASQEPEQGMFAYFMSFKPGHFRTFSSHDAAFWCCVGSGMENHTKYGEAIYFHGADSLCINLFIPSTLHWKEKGLELEQRTRFPAEDAAEFRIRSAPSTELTILVRCPGWAAAPLRFQVNGQELDISGKPGEYCEIKRIWKAGDRLHVTLPMNLRLERLEGNPDKVAFLFGPLVLAGDFGPAPRTDTFPYADDQSANFRLPGVEVPVLIRSGADDQRLLASIKKLPDELAFRTEGLGKPADFTLRPFLNLHYSYQNVYWDVMRPEDWAKRESELRAKRERQQEEEARTIDSITFGEQQPEIDHQVASERSRTGAFQDRKWRDATSGGFIELQMKVHPGTPALLRCTYWGSDQGREFDILVNGKLLATEKLNRHKPGHFYDRDYPLDLPAGQERITVRFEPRPGSIAGGFFHVATMKPLP